MWKHQIDALGADADVRIADNHGADSVAALAREVLEQAPSRFALAAHAMGGFIAFEMWRQAPERIERLALLDTLATADTPQQIARREGYAELVRKGEFRRVIEERIPLLLSPLHQADERLLAIARTMAEETGAEAFLRQQHAIIHRPDSRPTLPTISCPTLVVVGREDRITSVADAAGIAGAIPNARLEIVEESGHLVPLEQPARTSALLRSWLGA